MPKRLLNSPFFDLWRSSTFPGRIGEHFGSGHVLADVAARNCSGHRSALGVRGVACGTCWEQAIRDDERFAVECGLPRELSPDPDFVDEIAVELACRGEHVSLTPVEREVAVRRLLRRGWCRTAAAERLAMSYHAVVAIIGPLPISSAAA